MSLRDLAVAWHDYDKNGWFYRMRVRRDGSGVHVEIQRKDLDSGFWRNWTEDHYGYEEAAMLKQLLP